MRSPEASLVSVRARTHARRGARSGGGKSGRCRPGPARSRGAGGGSRGVSARAGPRRCAGDRDRQASGRLVC